MTTTCNFTAYTHVSGSSNMIVNPDRGFFTWMGKATAPVTSPNTYKRYNWSQIEGPSSGQYNFSDLWTCLSNAANNHAKFGFGVRCMVQGSTSNSNICPAYLHSNMALKWFSNSKNCWVPDWNDTGFLTAVGNLTSNLGNAFNKHPNLDYMEIRTYGNFGEWQMSRFEPYPRPNGAQAITDASISNIIGNHEKFFPTAQIIMMSDNSNGLSNAMYTSGSNNGWRRDSWGHSNIFDNIKNERNAWPAASNRCLASPIIVESIGPSCGGMTVGHMLRQVQDYHISRIANGNFYDSNLNATTDWKKVSPALQTEILDSADAAGYKYVCNQVTFPSTYWRSKSGTSNKIQSTWSNVGNCPTYNKWQVWWRLFDSNGALDSYYLSPLVLSNLKGSCGISVTDWITIDSSTTTNGVYMFDMVVTDANNVYPVMNLYTSTRSNNHKGYTIGAVTVSNI